MSCSYGPGRYDTTYEEDGHDYPFAYVRWTEQRNVEAFLELVSRGLLKIRPLISHTFDIDAAEQAYEIVLGKTQMPSMGILLRYPSNERKLANRIELSPRQPSDLTIGFIGAGSFAQSYLIPNARKFGASLHTVVTSKGINAKNVAQKFGFGYAASDAGEILKEEAIKTVFIATPHNSHATYAVQAMQASKHVFVEKPLALTYAELEQVEQAHTQSGKLLLVGFNRRFSEAAKLVDNRFGSIQEPRVMNFRVNAGFLPKEHWTQKLEVGGGRILGEVCHFVDLMQFFANSNPIRVFAVAIQTPNEKYATSDNVSISLQFANGSIGTITYTAVGDGSLGKEHLEVFCGGKVGIINDFKSEIPADHAG